MLLAHHTPERYNFNTKNVLLRDSHCETSVTKISSFYSCRTESTQAGDPGSLYIYQYFKICIMQLYVLVSQWKRYFKTQLLIRKETERKGITYKLWTAQFYPGALIHQIPFYLCSWEWETISNDDVTKEQKSWTIEKIDSIVLRRTVVGSGD